MRCRDCKYWQSDSYATKHCRTPANDFGLCEKFSDDEDDFEMSENYGMNRMANAICYSEGIEGQLITRPEFGCVEFESKE